jgi:hypothetical protein
LTAAERSRRTVDERYLAGTCRLEKALDETDALRGATAEEAAAHGLELSHRLAKIDGVLTLLGAVALST